MKSVSKILAVLLAVLMLSTCAFAVDFAADIEIRKAPELVRVIDANGKATIAQIHDAQGNLLAGLDEILVTELAKAEFADKEIREELEKAYKELKAANTLESLCDKADDVLAELDQFRKIEEMHVVDLINITMDDEYRTQLETEGNTITLTFKLDREEYHTLLVLEQTVEDEWITAPVEDVKFNEDDTVTITVNNVHHLAFALPRERVEFTPSIEQKGSPDILDEDEIIALIVDENGDVEYRVRNDELIVTALSEAKNAQEPIRTMLLNAYVQIKNAGSIAEFAPDAEAVLAEIAADLTIDDMVVRDLFDISLAKDPDACLAQDGHMMTLKFKLGLKPDDVLLVLNNYKDDLWKTIPNDCVEIHEDGSVSVTFESLSPIAFVVEGSALSVDMEKTSPQTGMGATASLMTAGIGAVGVAAVGILRKKFHK